MVVYRQQSSNSTKKSRAMLKQFCSQIFIFILIEGLFLNPSHCSALLAGVALFGKGLQPQI